MPQRPRWLLIAFCAVIAFAVWAAADYFVWYHAHGGVSVRQAVWVLVGLAVPIYLALMCYSGVRWAALLVVVIGLGKFIVDLMWLTYGKGKFYGLDMTGLMLARSFIEDVAWLTLGIGVIRTAGQATEKEAE
ncbi:MAG TPA: hypothetical protein VNI20_09750 [Fimbriimonadaceae bacterium]|nr:hypothetical protein [Fimbriimonadaceae bacterium]